VQLFNFIISSMRASKYYVDVACVVAINAGMTLLGPCDVWFSIRTELIQQLSFDL